MIICHLKKISVITEFLYGTPRHLCTQMQDHLLSIKFPLCAMLIVASRQQVSGVWHNLTAYQCGSCATLMWFHKDLPSQPEPSMDTEVSSLYRGSYLTRILYQVLILGRAGGAMTWMKAKIAMILALLVKMGTWRPMPYPKDITLSSLSAPCCPDLYTFYLHNDHIPERSTVWVKYGSKLQT